MSTKIQDWCHGFVKATKVGLLEVFKHTKLESPEDRALYAKWALGEDDQTGRPCYYKIWPENEGEKKQVCLTL